jgi:hypothetical integral membrane protein (TIGR02206 family)
MLVIALAAAAAVLLARRFPAATRAVERVLAAGLVGGAALFILLEAAAGIASPLDYLPFHLCDMAIFVAAYALLTHRRLACELLYFWAFAGTLLAIATPDLAADFPSRSYLFYFGLHGGVVTAAALVVATGHRPRPGAPVRAWLLTNAYAGLVAVVDVATGANFMYLVAKPDEPTLLDWFGPWPIYLLVAEVVAIALFSALYLPFRRPR